MNEDWRNELVTKGAAIDAQEAYMADHPLDGYEDELVLIDILRNLPPAQPQDIARDIATIIENEKDMRVMLQQRWIPCSERLPEAEYGEGDSVLCCTESGLMYILFWHGGNWCVPTGEPHHWVNHKTGWHDKVIAWMPLPEPFKGGQNEN